MTKWPTWLGVLFALCLTGALMAPISDVGRATAAVMNLGHAPAFGLLALIVHRLLARDRAAPSFATALMAWAIVVTLGAGAEWLQTAIGRRAGWHDIGANALGAAAFLIFERGYPSGARLTRIGAIAASLALLALASAAPSATLVDVIRQRREMPRVASFEHELELSRWNFKSADATRSTEHATDGRWSLRVDLLPGRYPGAGLVWPYADWAGYDEIRFDAYLDPGPPLPLILKIQDEGHNHLGEDRFQRRTMLQPGSTTVSVRLADVTSAPRGRNMDLSRIQFVQWFTVRLDTARTLYLDNVRLLRDPAPRIPPLISTPASTSP